MSTKFPLNTLAAGKRESVVKGMTILKGGDTDDKLKEQGMEKLSTELGEAVTLFRKHNDDYQDTAKIVKELQDRVQKMGEADGETQAALTKAAADLAEQAAITQACSQKMEELKKEMDAPVFRNQKDLQDHDREMAIKLQENSWIHKGRDPSEFTPDLDNLVNVKDLRSVATKMIMQVGLVSKSEFQRGLSEPERKAFEAANLDSGFLMPETLGMEVDCEIECASLIDLYEQVSVSRSVFQFPHVESYGDIGKYDCDAKCDAEYGPEGNITWKNGQTYDWRGMFCFQRDTLREANYDLLGFMLRAVARSYRINRNEALIRGDGVNAPLGWLTGDAFTKVAAPAQNPTHQDLRQFLASHPVERGFAIPVMHQNTFAYFASMVDNNGRFIFGDGLMGYGPGDVRENIRISNCLPDPTQGGVKGSRDNPFDAGSFIMAAGDWKSAYAAVSHRPMFMEQHIAGSSAWCASYQFGAKDGGFVACAPAARTFQAGAAPVGG